MDEVIELSSDSDKTQCFSPYDVNNDYQDIAFDGDWDDVDGPGISYAEFESKVAEPVVVDEHSNDTIIYVEEDLLLIQPTEKEPDKGSSPFHSTGSLYSDGFTQLSNSKPLSSPDKRQKKLEKELNKAEKKKIRDEKKEQAAREKAVKASIAAKQKSLKPEESIKLLKVHIDIGIVNEPFGSAIIPMLQQEEIRYHVESLMHPRLILWKKTVKDTLIDDSGSLKEVEKLREEEELVHFITWQQIVQFISKRELIDYVKKLRVVASEKNITLFVVGLEKYFNFWKYRRNMELKEAVSNSQRPKQRKKFEMDGYPRISQEEFSLAMTELQLTQRINHRKVETAEEIASAILQFTKAISQIEYKKDKYDREQDSLSWYAKADSKSCIRVDKHGNGLASLWQQQICQFNSVGLEVAQAIADAYGSPQALITAYRKCSSANEAELLLENIAVRRDAGILSSTRRVGPELSKKIYRFMMASDGNTVV